MPQDDDKNQFVYCIDSGKEAFNNRLQSLSLIRQQFLGLVCPT